MVFEENNPTDFKFSEENPLLEGVLINRQENVGINNSMLYTLEVNGKPINVWGCTILDQNMVGINIGDLIQIVYKGLGEAKGGKNPPKIFQVLKDRPVMDRPVMDRPDPVPSTPGTLV